MHDSERNRLLKLQRALLLAASDMEQATAAATALDNEPSDVQLMRALETSIAVCYARPFTQSSLLRLDADEFRPRDEELAEMHKYLLDLRDRVHAHTDKQGGRDVAVEVTAFGALEVGGQEVAPTLHLTWREEWLPFPRAGIPAALRLFEGQREYMRQRAASIQAKLDGLSWPAIGPRPARP